MFSTVKRVGSQRLVAWNAVSALKREQVQATSHGEEVSKDSNNSNETQGNTSTVCFSGPILRQDGIWRNDVPTNLGSTLTYLGVHPLIPNDATQPSLPPQLQLLHQVQQPQAMDEIQTLTTAGLQISDEIPQRSLQFEATAGFYEQPVANMEAFLQELSEELTVGDLPGIDPTLPPTYQDYGLNIPPTTTLSPFHQAEVSLEEWNSIGGSRSDPMRTVQHFNSLSFESMHQSAALHLWTVGPLPDMSIFYLFRKVHSKEHADRAVDALLKDRECRNYRGISTPYSEVASAAVFNALNRTGGEDLVVAAAEQSAELGLTLSRSNMYHLMKQYSVQGKVEHVEKLFRALERAGKSWNSNCVVIMMLAYFNRGKFEEADKLRHELRSRGIKISERIEKRLEGLLSGEERWRWEDQVYYRPKRKSSHGPPPGFPPIRDSISPIQTLPPLSRGSLGSSSLLHNHLQQRGMHSQTSLAVKNDQEAAEETGYVASEQLTPTLTDAVKEPRIHLNILRAAGFDDLYNVLTDFVKTKGTVENVCISFLFRKVETIGEAERAMKFLDEERAARVQAGIAEDYNETTCSRIFTALFRTGASDLAFTYAKNASGTGLVLSGKALHELLKSFATKNEVDKVEQIWEMVKINGKPSSRIVYSIFRTYFDNGMTDRASAFRDEIQGLGINLSASATRNIDDVLSGVKRWVKDPHAGEF